MAKYEDDMTYNPVTFRVDKEIHEYVEDVMIERRQFNRSHIHREIYMLGLEVFKEKQDQRKKGRKQ